MLSRSASATKVLAGSFSGTYAFSVSGDAIGTVDIITSAISNGKLGAPEGCLWVSNKATGLTSLKSESTISLTENETLKLYDNVALASGLTVSGTGTVDLNGFVLSNKYGSTIDALVTSSGKLTVIDSKGKGGIENKGTNAIVNNGELIIGSSSSDTFSVIGATSAVSMPTAGTALTINGGSYTGETTAIDVAADSTDKVNIKAGSYSGTKTVTITGAPGEGVISIFTTLLDGSGDKMSDEELDGIMKTLARGGTYNYSGTLINPESEFYILGIVRDF